MEAALDVDGDGEVSDVERAGLDEVREERGGKHGGERSGERGGERNGGRDGERDGGRDGRRGDRQRG